MHPIGLLFRQQKVITTSSVHYSIHPTDFYQNQKVWEERL